MPVTRDQFDTDPFISKLPQQQQDFLRRRYFDSQVKPALAGVPVPNRAPVINAWGYGQKAADNSLDVDSNPITVFGKTLGQDLENDNTMTGRAVQLGRSAMGNAGYQSFDQTVVPQGTAAGVAQTAAHELAMMGDPASWLVGGAAGKVAGKAIAGSTNLVARTAARAPRLTGGMAAGGAIGGGNEALRQANAGQFDPLELAKQTAIGAGTGLVAGGASDLAAHIPAARFNPRLVGRAPVLEGESPAVRAAGAAEPIPDEAPPVEPPPSQPSPYAKPAQPALPTNQELASQGYSLDEQLERIDALRAQRGGDSGEPPIQPVKATPTALVTPEEIGASAAQDHPPAFGARPPRLATGQPPHPAGYSLDDMQEIAAARRQPQGNQFEAPPQPAPLGPQTRALVPVDTITAHPPGTPAPASVPPPSIAPNAFTDQVGQRPGGQPATLPRAMSEVLPSGTQVTAPGPGAWKVGTAPTREAVLHSLAQGGMPPAEVMAQHPDIAQQGEQMGGHQVQAQQGSGMLEHLLRGEEGQATPEGALGIPAAAAGAAAHGALGLARGVAKPLGMANRFIDAGLNAIAEHTHINSIGNQLADGGLHLLREAGNDHPTLGPVLKAVRGFTQSDAGLPADYTHARDVSAPARADELLRPALAKADEIRANHDPVTQEALHDAITMGHDSPEANAVRAIVDPVSQTLLDTGALTQAQYEAWAGKYLPRLYEKYLSEMPVVAGLMRSASKALKGSRSRGKLSTVDPDRLGLMQRDWQPLGTTTADGKVTLEDAANGDQIDIHPKHLGDYVAPAGSDAAHWKPVRTSGNKVVAWRDYSPEERAQMGEVKDVALALETLAQRSYKDLKNGLLLKDVSNNPEWSQPVASSQLPPEGWVHFSNEQGANGVAKWGALQDHYVHPAIARDLQASIKLQSTLDNIPGFSELMGFFKRSKTILSPTYYVNNVMQNVPILELAGGDLTDHPEAIHQMATGGELHQQAAALGLYRDSGLAREIAGRLSGAGLDASNPIGFALKAAGALEQEGAKFAQACDDSFKLALVIGKMRTGMSMPDAVKYSNETFYDSSRVNSPLARIGAATAWPFIKPFLHFSVKLPELAARNPAKMVKLALYYQGAQMVMNAMNGESQKDADARDALMPEYMKGNNQKLPFTDTKGQQLVVDTKNWNPLNVYDTSDRTAAPTGSMLPQALVPTGPIATAFALKSNYDDFKGKAIADKATSPGSQARQLAAYLVKDLGPGVIGQAGKVAGALTGTPDPGGRVYDLPTALANFVGIKAQPFDADGAYAKMARNTLAQVHAHQMEVQDAGRQLAKGVITQAEFQAVADEQKGLIAQTLAQFQGNAATAAPALAKKGASPPRLATGGRSPAAGPAASNPATDALQAKLVQQGLNTPF
jgi:hypothetical protein